MRRTSTAPGDWLRRFHPAPDGKIRLVCFPHAGGAASFYHPLSVVLTPDVEVVAVQYPGRQDRRHEPGIDAIDALAEVILPIVRPLADRPLAFFGHSMGALVAYEVALRLEDDGAAPLARLYASGRRAPSRYRPDGVHRLGDAGILAELRRLGGTDAGLLDDPETQEMIMPALRTDYRAVETYRHVPGRALKCPVLAVIGDDDPRVTEDEARAWGEHTRGPFDLRVYPGGHFYLVEQSQAIIRLIRDDLAAVS